MSYLQDNTNPNGVQPPRAAVEAALSQHFSDLSQSALYWHYVLANAMQLPPALPVGCIGDGYLGQCLLTHLRQEFPDVQWPADWDALTKEEITKPMLVNLEQVSRRRIFVGSCEICKGWQERLTDCPAPATAEVLKQFITANKAANLSEASIKSYSDTLKPFARAYPKLPAKPEDIEAYLAKHQGNGTTGENIYLVIRLLYNWASARLGVPNPMPQVKRPRSKAKPPQHLSQAQAQALLNAIQTVRERGLVYCLFGLGLRLSEVRRLKVADIGEDTILIHGKERDESLPLPAEIRDALAKLTEGSRPQETVFQGRQGPLSDSTIQLITKTLFDRAGITGVRPSPHTLRHTKGVLSTINGLDQFSNKRLLRHASTEMTDRYNELNLGELRQKDNQYNPLLRLLNKGELGKKPDCAQC